MSAALTPTWYDLLGVEQTASADEIRSAWRSSIADLDPTERRFATLNEAAAVLLDPDRRSAYDASISPASAEPVEATEPASPAEPVEAPDAPDERPRRAPYLVPGWVLAVVGVVALAAVALAGVLAPRESAAKVVQADAELSSGTKVTRIEDRAVAAQAAAKEAIVPALSYDYRKLDTDQARAESYMTDAYRTKYDRIFALIKKNAPGTQTVITAKVVDSGIVRVDADRVQVLLFVDRPTTNKASATPIPYQDQVTATMRRVGDAWLIDNLVTTPLAQ
ncbi:J domain-containing protein [Nocardioides sp. Iso805N]|uniref:J domain-containing protein n=1 Tax=Nocardioides sp. Iso805N TaxID=1283287 RepID=UPI0003740C74|nr:DnaJ domain-containing protein [Nocardioides sp. Iso805N]